MAHWLKYGSFCQVIAMYGSCKPNNISIYSNIKRREFSKLLLLYTPALHLPLLTCTCFFFILYVFCCVYVLLMTCQLVCAVIVSPRYRCQISYLCRINNIQKGFYTRPPWSSIMFWKKK
eukprot:459442_1